MSKRLKDYVASMKKGEHPNLNKSILTETFRTNGRRLYQVKGTSISIDSVTRRSTRYLNVVFKNGSRDIIPLSTHLEDVATSENYKTFATSPAIAA